MAVNVSFSGKIANPVIDARLRMAMSGPALAKRLGLSRQYISKAEQGTYTTLNPALLRWTSNALSITVTGVEKRYRLFQEETRRQTIERVAPHRLTRSDGNKSPGGVLFENWRSGYWTSSTQFAVAFCVHPDLVSKYEEGITKTMPKQIKEILVKHNLMDQNWVDDPSEVEATSAPLTA